MLRRALVVGIDNYSALENLAGCVNDAQALAPLFARNEDDSPNFDVRTLAAPTVRGCVTRDDLLKALDRLFAPGVHMSLFYFAGHGEQAGDAADVVLATTDGTRHTPGVRFGEVLDRINACEQEVAVILDCCFSGAAGGFPAAMIPAAVLRQGVSMLTASRADQTSAETPDGRGQFSAYLEGALEGGAADVLGHLTLAGLYSYLSEAFGPWTSVRCSRRMLTNCRTFVAATQLSPSRPCGNFPHGSRHRTASFRSTPPMSRTSESRRSNLTPSTRRCSPNSRSAWPQSWWSQWVLTTCTSRQ